MAKAVISLIVMLTRVNNDMVFTEQMLLWLEKEMALGEEWSLGMVDLCMKMRR